MIVAAAGRRIDALDATAPRFPAVEVDAVEGRILDVLRTEQATGLVSSAACGADLLAQKAARVLRCRCRVVLPFAPEIFKRTSVLDRPGNWGPLFDEIVEAACASGDLVVLPGLPGDREVYLTANKAILDEAQDLARHSGAAVCCLVIWDGASRGADDVTAHFRDLARGRGMPVLETRTNLRGER